MAAALSIGVHGASGRMGREVLALIAASPELSLAWAGGREVSEAQLAGTEGPRADVIIDFSTPAGLERLLAVAAVPVVSGTTGAITLPEVPSIPLLHAANFSLGVAVLAKLVAAASAALPTFDLELIELHHRGKRDAPSGTALRLLDASGRGGPRQSGRTGPRASDDEIGVHAIRAGDIVGDHVVLLAGPGERLELRHAATGRHVFAAGALAAARWLVRQPPGRYRIEDVLGG